MSSTVAQLAAAFHVPVEGVGTFAFAKRNMRTHMAVEVEFSRLTEGVEVLTKFAGDIASAMADLKVLTVEAPSGWDIDELDAFEAESFEKLMKVWGALRDKEVSFRKERKIAREGGGGGDGDQPRVLVPA